jgi:ABC-type antimicrobial peptide transport system permease subunit
VLISGVLVLVAREGITEFVVSPVQLSVYLAVAGVAGVLAAMSPARRATRPERRKGHGIH